MKRWILAALVLCPAAFAEEPARRASQLGPAVEAKPDMKPAPAAAATKPKRVPDLSWFPRVGHKAYVWTTSGDPAIGTGDSGSAEILARAQESEDAEAIQRLRDTKTVIEVPSETMVRIQNMERSGRSGPRVLMCELSDGKNKGATVWFPEGSIKWLVEQGIEIGATVKVGTAKDKILFAVHLSNHASLMAQSRQPGLRAFNYILKADGGAITPGGYTAIVLGVDTESWNRLVKIRALGGPLNGKEGWVPLKSVVAISAPVDTAVPVSRAEAALKIGRQLEKVGDNEAAIASYRRAIKADRTSKEAAEATDRIKALGALP